MCDAQRAWPKCMERGSIHGNTLLCERVVQVLLRSLLALHCVAQ